MSAFRLPGPEAELLLACARLQLSPEQRQRIEQLLTADLDWPLLMELAEVHGLRPLLYRHLDVIASEAVPKAIAAELWARHQALARRNRAMADELKTVLRLLEAHDIPSIPYKGPMLALTVYGDLALREFGDLDLLLRPGDILQAKGILATHGYLPEFPLAPAVEAAFLRSRANYHLVMQLERVQRTVLVELHWKTDPEFQVEPINDDSWWVELPRIKLDELDVRSFAAHESLLILCLHGSKHFWASLGWLVDVSELIKQQPALDWVWILATADRMRAGRRLAYGLFLLRKLLDAPLPASVLKWMSGQGEAESLADDSLQLLFDPAAPGSSPWQMMRLNFRMYETWPQRLRHASDVIFSPSLNEWSRWPLPRPLFFLYRPLRLFRLLSKHASALIRPNATLRS